MPYLRGGQQRQHPVHHAQARAQNRHQRQLAPGQLARFRRRDGRFNLDLLGGQVARRLIAQQRSHLADKLLKFLCACVFAAHDAYLVLHKGVIHNLNLAHCLMLLSG